MNKSDVAHERYGKSKGVTVLFPNLKETIHEVRGDEMDGDWFQKS
jgi:hypothetical protein